MLLEVTKKEMVEINLPKTRFVNFCGSIYYRFKPTEDNIDVLRINVDTGTELLTLKHRKGLYESDLDIISLTHEYAKEITEEEFNSVLQKELLEHI